MTETLTLGALPEAQKALEQLKPALAALAASERAVIRGRTVPAVVSNLLAIATTYTADRPLFEAAFRPEAFAFAAADELPTRALAAWQADIQYRLALDPKGELARLKNEATTLRRKITGALSYLWGDDTTELGARVREILAGRGWDDTADDLMTGGTLLTE